MAPSDLRTSVTWLDLVPRLRMSGAIPLRPLYPLKVWTGSVVPLLYRTLPVYIFVAVLGELPFYDTAFTGWDF